MTTEEESINDLKRFVYVRYTNTKHKFIVVEGKVGDDVVKMVSDVFNWFYHQSIYNRITFEEFNDHKVTFEKKY